MVRVVSGISAEGLQYLDAINNSGIQQVRDPHITYLLIDVLPCPCFALSVLPVRVGGGGCVRRCRNCRSSPARRSIESTVTRPCSSWTVRTIRPTCSWSCSRSENSKTGRICCWSTRPSRPEEPNRRVATLFPLLITVERRGCFFF